MRCRLFHDWSKWGALQHGRKLWDGKDIGALVFQTRECQRCGEVAMRVVND